MPTEFIVAIELGSSKITGIAGRKNLDNSITVLAVVKEDSSSYIRRGVVYNLDRTMQALISIKTKLEQALNTKIRQVYVGVGGQSILSVKNVIVKDMGIETIVSQNMVNEMMDANRANSYPDQEILDAVPQEYKIDSQRQTEPVGIPCSRLEGNFLNILWRRSFYKNLNKCFEKANVQIAEMRLAPLALADSVLAEAEKRSGCVLVDLGAETTTVQVYHKNVLRHLAVIPLGGNNITKDLASLLQMEEVDAEAMKLKYGCAYTDCSDIDPNITLPIDHERSVEQRKFIDIVECRLEEIIKNVWFQVSQTDYSEKLISGIILTGGGANMKNIERAFRVHTSIEKIRVARSISQPIDATQPEITQRDCTMNTVLGLLSKGDMNCAGDELKNDIFESNASNDSNDVVETGASQTYGKGVVKTQAEKEAEEEEMRRRAEEEEERRIAEEKRIADEERARKRENSFFNKTKRGLKGLVATLFEPE